MRNSYDKDFEKSYLRYDYLTRIKQYDPNWVSQHKNTVEITSMKMYEKLRTNFNLVGFDGEDLKSIGNIYMLAYMGLYSLETNEKLRNRFVVKFLEKNKTEPTKQELAQADRNNLINFLRQRIQHCSTICERKSRNIKAGRAKMGIYAETKHSKPVCDELLLEDHKKYGYRSVTQKEYREIKSKSDSLIDQYGYGVRLIQIPCGNMEIDDYEFIRKNIFCDTYSDDPEEMMLNYESDKQLEYHRNKFDSLTVKEKISMLRSFIKDNSNDSQLKNELKTARKTLGLLKEMKKSEIVV
ncbi:MAG TPA: hypothetical protein VI911_11540 [Patescibacteria group bacterium]|nr:hypothetical protein [Patescibacteria group bacterium]